MNSNLSCDEIRPLLVLYPYGELSFDEEESVDLHLKSCDACQEERAALAALHATADEAAVEPSLELLSACRHIAALPTFVRFGSCSGVFSGTWPGRPPRTAPAMAHRRGD